MLRILLSLLLFANSVQAAPMASRLGSSAPGRLPALSSALTLTQDAAAAILSAPSLTSGILPTLSTPILPAANAASPEIASIRAPLFAPRAAQNAKPVNKADDELPKVGPSALEAAEDLAEAITENSSAEPNALEIKMSHAFDGTQKPLHILMTAGEANPYVKTGGLADVVGDVAPGLAKKGHKVSLVLPLYASISPEQHGLTRIPGAFGVPVGNRIETARLWTKKENGADIFFVEHEEFYGRNGAYGYDGSDFRDNDERYIFHARASLEAMRFLDTPPDIVHAHDWHVGLIPAYLKLVYNTDPFFKATRSVLTIHNIAYQGMFPQHVVEKAGFSMDHFTFDQLEFYGHLSFLKAGIVFADAVTTVSPTYAKEIQTERFGHGLQGLLTHRAQDMVGILNGIDSNFYNPQIDPRIAFKYGPSTVREGKTANKRKFQSRFDMDRTAQAPIFGIASRLAHQKGIDLVTGIVDFIVGRGGMVVVTGSGESHLEEKIDALVHKHPRRVFRHGFDTVFVHTVYAISDFLLMPSRFEPCGLSQMMAHAYGGLPIATHTGGLADSIIDLYDSPDHGNGFFIDDFTTKALQTVISNAFDLYADEQKLEQVQRRAMAVDHSWKSSLTEYERLYHALLK